MTRVPEILETRHERSFTQGMFKEEMDDRTWENE